MNTPMIGATPTNIRHSSKLPKERHSATIWGYGRPRHAMGSAESQQGRLSCRPISPFPASGEWGAGIKTSTQPNTVPVSGYGKIAE